MLGLITVLTAIIGALYLRMTALDEEDSVRSEHIVETNATFNQRTWRAIIEHIGVPAAQYLITLAYSIYLRLTVVNVMILILKYVPTGYYTYKFVKDIYLNSRERIKQKQIEIEDIQLQIQIVNTKLCVRDAEFTERAEQLRRSAERLRVVRARVRDVIAADESLQRALDSAPSWDADWDEHPQHPPAEEERDFLMELLKQLKFDHYLTSERSPDKMECGEREPSTAENSVYSSLSDPDGRQDCCIKIVKVTNVYRIAYLKHYIKQKRLRRAMKQAVLKKKMENIKKLLEDWQKTLNMVINSKLTILNIDPHPMDVPSQEAMGDYSKPRESSDSDSDLRNSWSDMCYDEYNLNWAQNPYKPYVYNYEDLPDASVSREFYDSQDYGDGKYPGPPLYCECGTPPNMMSIVEETNSQLAFAETKSETEDDYECRDLILL